MSSNNKLKIITALCTAALIAPVSATAQEFTWGATSKAPAAFPFPGGEAFFSLNLTG